MRTERVKSTKISRLSVSVGLRNLGPAGIVLILAMCVAAALTVTSSPFLNTSGQLLLKVACLVAIQVGLRRYRPRNPAFWWALSGYFLFAAIRNVFRVLIAVTEGQWTFLTGASWELGWNALAAASMCVASIWLLRSRRLPGNWAVADAWVLGVALLLTMICLTSIPLARHTGFSAVFWNVGALSVVRDCFMAIPIIAFTYSERIRFQPITVFGGALALITVSSLAYNSVGANLPTTQVLSAPAVLALGGVQSVGQLVMGAMALLPVMRSITIEVESERPMWGAARTVVMCAAVVAPLLALYVRAPLQGRESIVIFCGFSGLMMALVLRMRIAVVAANRSINEVSYLALHDPLTGLENRRSLQQWMIPSLSDQVQRDGEVRLSCYYLDVDDLKSINDRTSHAGGDALLTQVAKALTDAMPPQSTVVRFGGDEFIALTVLSGPDPEAESIRLGGELAAAVNNRAPDEHSMELRASIGGSWTTLRTDGGATELQVRHLIHEADLAQVAAKQAGGRRLRFYDASLGDRAHRRRTVSMSVDSAWSRGEMTLAYQPVVALADNSIYGAESLLRWNHPELGAIPPPEAIQAAEDLGVIDRLGLNILDKALHDMATSEHASNVRVGVNLSAQQLRPEAIDDLLEHIASSGLADNLWLEVTEQLLVEERSYAAGALNDLRDCGVVVAIDDFGTGYCGLDYLCTLPVDIVKLDGVFARHADSSTRQRVARLGAQLADAIGAETLAEGIESVEIANRMQDLGFRYGQGYAFRRPAASLEAALRVLT